MVELEKVESKMVESVKVYKDLQKVVSRLRIDCILIVMKIHLKIFGVTDHTEPWFWYFFNSILSLNVFGLLQFDLFSNVPKIKLRNSIDALTRARVVYFGFFQRISKLFRKKNFFLSFVWDFFDKFGWVVLHSLFAANQINFLIISSTFLKFWSLFLLLTL